MTVSVNATAILFNDDSVQTESAQFAVGTAMMFVQTAAPTGWTKSTTHNNKALRVVSGAASSGGTVAFTTAFASKAVAGTVGSTTLALADIPSHAHGAGASANAPTLAKGQTSQSLRNTAAAGNASTANGGGGSHNHTFSGTAIDLAVQYVDVIIATKN